MIFFKCHFTSQQQPFIHPIVNNRIDTRVCHGEPVEREEHVLREPGLRENLIQKFGEDKSLRQ